MPASGDLCYHLCFRGESNGPPHRQRPQRSKELEDDEVAHSRRTSSDSNECNLPLAHFGRIPPAMAHRQCHINGLKHPRRGWPTIRAMTRGSSKIKTARDLPRMLSGKLGRRELAVLLFGISVGTNPRIGWASKAEGKTVQTILLFL